MNTLTKGTILADTYEITGEIGSGGGGIVFKGRHLRLDTDIVVKKIKNEIRTLIDVKKEANTLKNLKHQYLPRVYDFIEREDGVYTVMDFIQGENMEAAVQRHGKYSQKQVMKWANQLGAALKYLHSRKIPVIHGDIKPANIMLTLEGDVCLIDFNISLSLGKDARQATGISAGYSPPEQYYSPELYMQMIHERNPSAQVVDWQVRKTAVKRQQVNPDGDAHAQNGGGRITAIKANSLAEAGDDSTFLIYNSAGNKVEQVDDRQATKLKEVTGIGRCTRFMAGRIDTRSDIYSLGATLYFMLTGIEPSVDFERRIPIGKINADIKEGFMLVLEKMMEISPNNRYQNGTKYLNALNNCYKLDHQYVVMRRIETAMQLASVVFLFCGVLAVFNGRNQIQIEKDNAYYVAMQGVREAMNLYDYVAAGGLIAKGKEILQTRIEAYEQEVYLLYIEEDYTGCISLGENYIVTAPFVLETEEDLEIYGNIYYIVGNAYFELGDYTNAKGMFEYAIGYNQKNSLYFRDYAVTLAKLGQTGEAKYQLEKGIGFGLADDSIYMVQGEIAYVEGRYQEAADNLQQAVRTMADGSEKSRAVLLCVEAYKEIGDEAIDDEIELLEQYNSRFGNGRNTAITEYLADAYARKAQLDESCSVDYWQKSLQLFEDLCEQGHATYQIQENIAVIYENMDAFDEAEQVLLAMKENYPNRYEIYKRLACLEADRQQEKANEDRDYHQMQDYYEKAVELYPDGVQDAEMQMLDIMMQDIGEGGWLQ